ncbi:Do family serine endopeptidase [Anaerophaga thermohalophila]|jgi:Do/DeqQ family serine protease|uniref:Do family serine endopeptidase n=1 Tax=Anaerophaga thermohalophila TaxID=177400 RepID=UPI00031ECCF6|nr:Do family serine endopeptidase [Anaerophaga thermohalophila]
MMKRIASYIISGIIGGAIVTGSFFLLGFNEKQPIKIEHVSGTPAVSAVFTTDKNGDIVPLNFTDVAKEVMPSVVHIKSTQIRNVQNYQYRSIPDPFRHFFNDDIFERFFGLPFESPSPSPQRPRGPQTRVGTGSGVIISEDGYIVTNNHVIDNADDIEVTLHDNRVLKAKVIGADPSTDIALLQVRAGDLDPLPLANSDEVEVGEWVLAVGNPFNLNSTVTAGIISAKGRNINILHSQNAIESFIQTDAAINPGNSGGALVNLRGGLVGINTAIASPTGAYAGYGFAVPANIVSKVVDDLLKYGSVQRGYLGLMIREVDGNLAREKDLDVTSGVYVDSISENSAAGDAGVKEGDVITQVDDTPVKSTGELLEIIARHHPGDKVKLKINRFGEELDFDVVLRNREGETKPLRKEERDVLTILGVELEEADKETARRIGIEGGVKITRLKEGKLKRSTDVREGFIITKVNGNSVRSVESFVNQLEKIKGGVFLEGVYEDYPGKYYYAFGM